MKTFFMIKPDGIKRNLIGEIISRVEEKGFKKFGYISGPSKRADALFRKNGFNYRFTI